MTILNYQLLSNVDMPVLILLLALALDLLLGDPPNRYHPVVLMGHFIRGMARLAPQEGSAWRFVHGTVLVLSGVALFSLPLAWALVWVRELNPLAYLLLAALLLKATFAYMGLVKAARQVKAALQRGDLLEARRLVSWHLVSRDTSQLDASLIAAAAVESVAENITDGIVAPLLFFALAGMPGAWAYRFVNTCDSMLGYRDPLHEYLGKFAARLDDVLNFIPARLAGLLLVAAAGLAGENVGRAWETMWHQHRCTASPNAGWTMSAMAGALGVTLEKVSYYQLEGGPAPPEAETIDRALKVTAVTVTLFIALLGVVLTAVYLSIS
jgi:adenosylcobinamide-phosphate synthase